MAKMTQARVDRWNKDLSKALELARKTSIDVGNAKLTTSGLVYSNLIDIGTALTPVLNSLEGLTHEHPGRNPIASIRRFVVEAAERRKQAKAAKDAEKATA